MIQVSAEELVSWVRLRDREYAREQVEELFGYLSAWGNGDHESRERTLMKTWVGGRANSWSMLDGEYFDNGALEDEGDFETSYDERRASDAASELRELSWREGVGAWMTGRFTITPEGEQVIEVDFDNPPPVRPTDYSDDLGYGGYGYAIELRMFPRPPEHVPEWMKDQLVKIHAWDPVADVLTVDKDGTPNGDGVTGSWPTPQRGVDPGEFADAIAAWEALATKWPQFVAPLGPATILKSGKVRRGGRKALDELEYPPAWRDVITTFTGVQIDTGGTGFRVDLLARDTDNSALPAIWHLGPRRSHQPVHTDGRYSLTVLIDPDTGLPGAVLGAGEAGRFMHAGASLPEFLTNLATAVDAAFTRAVRAVTGPPIVPASDDAESPVQPVKVSRRDRATFLENADVLNAPLIASVLGYDPDQPDHEPTPRGQADPDDQPLQAALSATPDATAYLDHRHAPIGHATEMPGSTDVLHPHYGGLILTLTPGTTR